MSKFLGQPGIFQLTLLNFYMIPDMFHWRLPGGKTIPKSHTEKLLEIYYFPR